MGAPLVFDVAYGVTQAQRTNLCQNPSFGTNVTSWASGGAAAPTLARSTTLARIGSSSMTMTSTANGTSLASYLPGGSRMAVSASTAYTFSAYMVRPFGSTARTGNVYIEWYNAGGALISTSTGASATINTMLSGGWAQFSVAATSPATAATMRPYVQVSSTLNTEVFYVDAVLIEQASSLKFYFDGTNYIDDNTPVSATVVLAWTGTADASTSTCNSQTWTSLSNVQEVSGRIGRQLAQDVFTPSSASVTVRYPSGFASPITQIQVGTRFRIEIGTSDFWYGRLRDATVEYGIPYASSVGPDDYLQLDLEGEMAIIGRQQGNGYSMAAGSLTTQIATAATQTGAALYASGEWGTTVTNPNIGATTVNGSWLEWLNRLAATVNAIVIDGGEQITIYPRETATSTTLTYSDTTNDASNQAYDRLDFASMAANYYTRVQVETESYGNQVASTGSAPYRTYVLQTYNSSAGQATDLANYWLNTFTNAGVQITSFSTLAAAQNSFATPNTWYATPIRSVNVVFRGNTYKMTILGSTFNATPESARFTYYVAAADLTPYLILDSTIFGILDTNKLGY